MLRFNGLLTADTQPQLATLRYLLPLLRAGQRHTHAAPSTGTSDPAA